MRSGTRLTKIDFILIIIVMGTIQFYSTRGDYGFLSNFSRHPLIIDGKFYKTSEHYFQSIKFEGTEYEERIIISATPSKAAKIGRDRSLPLRKDWKKIKVNVMYKALIYKFGQNPKILNKLLATGNAKLVEHTKRDSFWGDGGDGTGKNMLGNLLMEAREELGKVLKDRKE